MSPKTPTSNKLRLAILYALRYQKFSGNSIAGVVDALIQSGVSADRARVSRDDFNLIEAVLLTAPTLSLPFQLVYVMLNLAGADQRQDDLFMNENIFSRGKSALKGLKVGLDVNLVQDFANHHANSQGVENVYTQHTPHLCQTLDLLLKGRLRETSYPFVEGDEHARTQRPQDIIVFMLGGTTYEESRAVALLNQQLAGQARILLAGTSVHNSKSFLDMMSDSALHHSPSVYGAPPGVANAASLTTGLAAAQQETPAGTASGPAPNNNSGINLRAGGYELSVGGAAGSGLYRASGTNPNDVGASFQIDGIRDGARNFFGNLRERVGETVQRVGSPRGE